MGVPESLYGCPIYAGSILGQMFPQCRCCCTGNKEARKGQGSLEGAACRTGCRSFSSGPRPPSPIFSLSCQDLKFLSMVKKKLYSFSTARVRNNKITLDQIAEGIGTHLSDRQAVGVDIKVLNIREVWARPHPALLKAASSTDLPLAVDV